MPSARALSRQLRQASVEFFRGSKKAVAAARGSVITPKFLEDHVEGATRAGQVTAALFLPFIIVVSLTIIRVINQIMAGVLGAGLIGGEQFSITAFLVTFITMGTLIIAAWSWFQWVRTSGFGAFA